MYSLMYSCFSSATVALSLSSLLAAQAGTDPHAPSTVPGEAPASTSTAPMGLGVVLPNAYKTKMGNTNNTFGVAWANQRYQQQHAAVELGTAKRLYAHGLRMHNATYTGPRQRLEIKLSNSATTPATHSPFFSTNIGTNTQTTVFKGIYDYPTMLPNADPAKFRIIFRWTTPWLWNPASGNFLMEILNSSAAHGNYTVDAANGETTVARSWGQSTSAAIGTVGHNFGLILYLFDEPAPPFAKYETFGQGCRGTGGQAGVIVPAAMRSSFGNTSNTYGVAWHNQRYHQIFTGSEVGRARVFVNHAWRPENRQDKGPTRTISILMNATTVSPGAISNTFASNITGTQTTVFGGRTITYPNMVPSTDPMEFKLVVPWEGHFIWPGISGQHLLYEYRCFDTTSVAYYPDAVSGNTSVSRLWGTGPTATTGSRNLNYGVVFCFGYQGPIRNVPVLVNDGVPLINASFDVTLVGAQPFATIAVLVMGFSKTAWGTISLPWNLTPIGADGCFLNVSFDLLFGVHLDANGRAKFTYAIPYYPSLYGAVWHNQYFIFDQSANKLGLVFTNGGTATVGGL